MAIFEEVRFTWNGQDHVLPPDQVLRCIAKIEDVITLGRLMRYQRDAEVPIAKVSQAFAIALRQAGARVTDEEVYNGMFSESVRVSALGALQALLLMMIPPEHLRGDPGKAAAPSGTAGSSPQPSKPQSDSAG